MSGKQAKKERKAQREAERRAAARAERRRTILTVVVVLVVLGLGSLLAFVSVEEDEEPLADQGQEDDAEEDDAEEESDDGADSDVAACEPAPPPEAAGEEKPTYDEPEQVLDPEQHDKAVITTSCGEVTLDLDHERAPEAVNSFVFLAQEGFFDGLRIFRHAESIAALQTGSGNNTGEWDLGYTLDDELEAAEEGYPPGSVAMANSGPDTSSSQFFFVYRDPGRLPPDYTRFAMVTEGLEVLRRIAAIPTEGPDGETPAEDVYLEQVTISS